MRQALFRDAAFRAAPLDNEQPWTDASPAGVATATPAVTEYGGYRGPVPAERELTIGELFPAEDVLAQWVYSVACVAEDVHVVMDLLKRLPRDEHSLRPSMYVWGLLMTRIYEARRVVWAIGKTQEVRKLVGDRLGPGGGLNLCEVYAKRDGGQSLVEELYSDARHRGVHHPWVGSSELEGLLRDHRGLPARLVIRADDDGKSVESQWVTAIRGRDMFGYAYDHSDFGRAVVYRRDMAAAIAQAWLMTAPVMLFVYIRRRGIPTERLIGDADALRATVERMRDRSGP